MTFDPNTNRIRGWHPCSEPRERMLFNPQTGEREPSLYLIHEGADMDLFLEQDTGRILRQYREHRNWEELA